MDRRDSIKSLLVGSLAGGLVLNGCKPGEEPVSTPIASEADALNYGRTDREKEIDAKLYSEQFFNEQEIGTLAVLCDLILPSKGSAGSATDAGVPEFIEFIVKDMPNNQLPIRGGMMWLDNRANRKFSKDFQSCSESDQRSLLDEIAYPDAAAPDVEQGVKFFTRMRNLVLTGYYTTKMGFDDLGYKGNTPNVWDGVPEDVLKKHGMAYEEEWLAKCVDQSKRDILAEWDAEGNLIT